jgi:TonB family protein
MIGQVFLSNLLAWALQSTLVTATAALVLPLLRVDAPSIRYAWWRTVLALCLVLPLLQPWQVIELKPPDTLVPPSIAPASETSGSAAASRAAPVRPPVAPVSWAAIAGIGLVAGVAARLAWFAAGLLRLRRLRRAGERAAPCDGHEELSKLIEAGAEIRYVPILGQPVTFGLRHPIVLLPDSLRRLPPPVQRAVLAHELWHVRRCDWAWVLTEESIKAVLWFHPAIWFVISRIQSAREEVVDELTILLTNSRRSYIEALLAFADEPPLFAAAPFARRRHLFQRMLLISREAVMSSRRIVASSAAMALVLISTLWTGASAFPLTSSVQVQSPPRDTRPGEARPATNRETQLLKAIEAAPQASVVLYYELSKLQENRGAKAEAEATLKAGIEAFPGHDGIISQLAAFYNRSDQFDRAVGVYENLAAADPSNPRGHMRVATFYFEKVQKDEALSPADKATYLQAGLSAVDRALTYDADYVEALVYKNLLLRMQANVESNSGRRAQLIAEADALRNRAMELNKAKPGTAGTKAVVGQRTLSSDIDGQAPVRIGGNIKPPVKVKDVRPAYPPDAFASRVQGVIILEAVIDASGRVREASILRSIPMLDEAALEAVRQWEFTPTLLNGAPVPVIMTVTVNFTLQ